MQEKGKSGSKKMTKDENRGSDDFPWLEEKMKKLSYEKKKEKRKAILN